ncbi:LysR family transcriptional regulator [Mameliella sediminis]|uniref:LysR family transcriptional regulator n=1 Tax=Mameliella sediminis TaxID=2836866 RepID=UPI001CD3DBFF|nr:LysR family transcriptional regulator [Mameliella alba]
MSDEDLNWNLLRTFYVIARERSITAASKRLGISQPSVSAALQKLETQLGCQLIFRDSRNFELTLAGDKVYAECREMFVGAGRIRRLVEDTLDDERGEVRLQIISNLVSPMVDELIRLYHQRHPNVRFHIEVNNSHEIVRNIMKGHVGLGICLLNRPVLNLSSMRLFREEFSLFCGCEHRLFGRDTVTLLELQQEPFISFTCATEGMGLEPMSVLRASADLGRRITGISSNLREVRRMIVAGLGIGLLPPDAVQTDIAAGNLWPLKLADHPIGADVYLVHAPEEAMTPADRRFISLTQEVLPLFQDGSEPSQAAQRQGPSTPARLT